MQWSWQKSEIRCFCKRQRWKAVPPPAPNTHTTVESLHQTFRFSFFCLFVFFLNNISHHAIVEKQTTCLFVYWRTWNSLKSPVLFATTHPCITLYMFKPQTKKSIINTARTPFQLHRNSIVYMTSAILPWYRTMMVIICSALPDGQCVKSK